MKSADFISRDARLYDRLKNVLAEMGAVSAESGIEGDVTQLTDENGRLFTVWEAVPRLDLEWRNEPFRMANNQEPPDVWQLVECYFECRWADLVVQVFEAVAKTPGPTIWLLDGNAVIWDVTSVDPLKLQL